MLRQGLISNQINYFMSNPRFEAGRDRAFEEFFGQRSVMLSRDRQLRVECDRHEALFVEWFFFHYPLVGGATPIAYVLAHNPTHVSSGDLDILRRLADGWYGFYEIRAVRPGEGLTLYDIMHKCEVFVHEVRGSMDTRAGTTIICRVAGVGGHYEIAGGKIDILPMVFGAEMQNTVRTWMKKGWTPKDTYQLILKGKSPLPHDPQETSLDDARTELQTALVACGIDHFADVATIERWMTEDLFDRYSIGVANALAGLAVEVNVSSDDQKDQLVAAVTALHNALPRQDLGGRSPHEARRDLDNESKSSPMCMDIQKIAPVPIGKYQRDGGEAMRSNDPERAIAVYNDLFEKLLEHHAVFSDPFRVFANLGVSYLMSGDRGMGKHLLKIAHGMNPDYEFAERQIERLEIGDLAGRLFDGFLARDGRTRKKKSNHAAEQFARIPAGRYAAWLKKLGINFAGRVREEITEFHGKERQGRVVYRRKNTKHS